MEFPIISRRQDYQLLFSCKSDLFVNSFTVISNKLEHGTKYYCV